jgi:Cytochrome P460
MKPQYVASILTLSACIVVVGMAVAAQDRFTVVSPNGIAFSEFKGYDAWQVIAPSQTADAVKAIVGNPLMIKAYNDGFPANGQAVPDGATMAKIAWTMKSNPLLPGAAMVSDTLKKVQFMIKDAKRFPETDGWGYADFTYDVTAGTFQAIGNGPAFAKAACHQCHTRVKARDFVFTEYAQR